MFSDLLKIVEFIKGAVTGILKLSDIAERRAASLEMLKTYFLILDTHRDGEKLLQSVTSDPVGYIKGLSDFELKAHLDLWDSILRRQGQRLYATQQYIASQSYLAVIDPYAQKNIEIVIGKKMSRLVTLHGLGAGLFFRTVFPIKESPENIAELVVQVLTKQESGAINLNAIEMELENLKKGLDQFRSVIMSLIDNNELRHLADEAREATQIGAESA